MKKLLTIGFILICLVSYSKPIPVYVLRYKGKVLDIVKIERTDKSFIDFYFKKNEISQIDLLDCLTKDNFYNDNDGVEFTFYIEYAKFLHLPKYLTVTTETFDFK